MTQKGSLVMHRTTPSTPVRSRQGLYRILLVFIVIGDIDGGRPERPVFNLQVVGEGGDVIRSQTDTLGIEILGLDHQLTPVALPQGLHKSHMLALGPGIFLAV